MPGYLDYGIPASWNPATRGGRGRGGVARPGAPATIALLAFRISRALERPLILHRLEKPEIKKGICVDIHIGGRGESWRNGLVAAFGTGSAFHPSRCSPSSHPCFGSFHDSLRIRRTRSNDRAVTRDGRKRRYDNNVAW